MTLANILEIICVKFHQNRFICLGCRDDTHRRTDAQTDTHTHTLGSIATYSVKMNEYKKHLKVFRHCDSEGPLRRLQDIHTFFIQNASDLIETVFRCLRGTIIGSTKLAVGYFSKIIQISKCQKVSFAAENPI